MRIVVYDWQNFPCALAFRSAWAKVWQAEVHLNELQSLINNEINPLYAYRTDYLNEYTYIVYDMPEFPVRGSLIVGNILTNARAALDHLVCCEILLNGGVITHKNRFPIYRESKNFFENIQRDLFGASQEFINMIEREYPGRSRIINKLNDLVNYDKHRSLSVVGGVSRVNGLKIWQSGEIVLSVQGIFPSKDGKTVRIAAIRRPFDNITVESAQFVWNFGEGYSRAHAGHDIVDELKSMVSSVRMLLWLAQDRLLNLMSKSE